MHSDVMENNMGFQYILNGLREWLVGELVDLLIYEHDSDHHLTAKCLMNHFLS